MEAVLRIPKKLSERLEQEAKSLSLSRKSLAILAIEAGIGEVKTAIKGIQTCEQ